MTRRNHTAILMALFLTLAGIETSTATPVWHQSTIKAIYPHDDGRVVVAFEADSANCTSGSSPKYYVIAVGANGVTADGLRNMLATLLAAAAQDLTVLVNFEDATSNCYINRIWVSYS